MDDIKKSSISMVHLRKLVKRSRKSKYRILLKIFSTQIAKMTKEIESKKMNGNGKKGPNKT